MKYLLLICTEGPFDPADHTPEELDAQPWVDELNRRGVHLTGDRVRPAGDATTVRVRAGETLVTDGPFAETKEQMGGFDIIECADLDEAIEIAARHPMAKLGMVEVRPFWPM
ncbi:YciI family protein [Actinophytocola sp.]|uniref:YciI family protein n=1 Tax=Actinophytocola sp. TaxID=1872138 RepID=UPI003D6C3A1B